MYFLKKIVSLSFKNLVLFQKRRQFKLFGFSKSEKENFISSQKAFIDYKHSIDQKENISYTSEICSPICCFYIHTDDVEKYH